MYKQIVVIGGGLSGLSAAHTAIENGANVVLIDKNPFCGGNSTKATSGLNAALTKTQIRKGIEDSAEAFENDTILSSHLGKDNTPYELAKVLTHESDHCVEWLTSKFGIDLSLVSRLGGHSFPRTHRGKERFPGMTITYALLEKLEEIEKTSNGQVAKIISKAKATRLITENGSVVGVEYEKDGKAHQVYGAVVIATGGFGADFTKDSLLNRYRPDLAHLPTTNGAHCTGDGIKMCESVGGVAVDMEWIQVHPTGLVHPDDPDAKVKWLAAEALRGVGGILLTSEGKRFCDELGRRDYVTGEMNRNKGPFRLILNSKAGKEIEWHCKHYQGRKLMKFFDSGAKLAAEMGIKPEVLHETFQQYNAAAKEGKDQYGKKYYHNTPFDVNDSFWVSIVTPVVHYTMGGIKISPEGQVMSADKTIPGLFAAGEVAGGVHGKNRLGGNSLLECVVFGRVAGRNIVKFMLRNNIEHGTKLVGTKCFNRLNLIKNQLKSGEENLKEYTLEDVNARNKDGDCWVILFGKVYDVSKFMVDHPGGKDSILLYAGQDATEQFDLMHQNSVLKKYGPAMCIGKLKVNKTSNKNVPPLLQLTPSDKQSRLSGGTSHLLPEERKKASFDVQALTHFINGGAESTKRRKFIESIIDKDSESFHNIYNFDRQEAIEHHVKEFVRIHKPYRNWKPTREDICYMAEASLGYGALNNSHGIFIQTIIGQGSEEQAKFWVPKLYNFEITGSYAQTELGHGSNVRGLQTTAIFDKETDEFVLNTPTLQAIKWWPGCLGKVATHVVLYAQLIIDGKEYGVNVFVLQIRDENHLPLPGIRVGDLANKIGDNSNDTGFLMLENVRIPREHLLCKYRRVTKEGKFEEAAKADPKVHYTTMMYTRASMVNTAAARLAQASTIAVRYSSVRQQGFKDSTKNNSFTDPENKIIDYKIQQYRLFKQLAYAYGMRFTGRWMIEQLAQLEGKSYGVIQNTELLKELAATSAGLKSLTTIIATNGIEDCRKCCGGNGYLLNSGIGAMACDYLWQITAEGDFIILGLMTGKHLIKSIGKAMGGAHLQGPLEYLNVIGKKDFNLVSIRPQPAKAESDFHSIEYLQSYFIYRAIERLYNVTIEINKLMKNGHKFDEAVNEYSNEVLAAAHSHCYLIIFNNFVNKLNEMKDPATNKVLARLCILFALCNFLDENWGDLVQGDQFRMIKNIAYQLMGEVRPDCVALVDAFDFPDNVIKSTIGRYDGNVYEALFDAAQKSVLNRTDPFNGYEKYLKPHLNKELLKKGNKPHLTGKF